MLEETGLEVTVGDVAWVGDAIGPGDPPAWHFAIVDFWATPTAGLVAAGGDAAAAEWVPIERLGSWPIVDTMVDLVQTLFPSGDSS